MNESVYVKEIFESIQGEGLYIGTKQLFIRFSKCNLNCKYCDTDFTSGLKEYGVDELRKIINDSKNIHSVSLTGGEPLCESKFLKNLLPEVNKKIYLETNGVLYNELNEIIDFVDIISADIKLPSSAGNKDLFDSHRKFIEIAKKNNKEIFVKVVFDNNIQKDEIMKVSEITQEFDIPLILQPETEADKIILQPGKISEIFEKFLILYKNTRLIPQMHKYINVR